MNAYSTESMGTVLFDYRIKVLDDPVPEKAKILIQLISEWNHTLGYLLFSIPWYKYFDTPTFKRFIEVEKQKNQMSADYVNMTQEVLKSKSPEERIDLYHFLKQEGLSDDEAFANVVGALFAGVDSITITALWLIYNLGRFPAVQQTLREEILSIVGHNNPITAENLKQLKYLRNTIKESLRLSSTSFGFMRVLPQPVVVSGYEIPPNNPIILPTYILSKNPNYFPDPNNFKPERYFTEEHPMQKWINLPFGTGPRMCAGFRLAELGLYVLAAKLVQHFEWKSEEEVEPIQKLFVLPDRPLKIHWKILS